MVATVSQQNVIERDGAAIVIFKIKRPVFTVGLATFNTNNGDIVFCIGRVPSGMRLEFGGAISSDMRLSF
jgi:hypothetical protein